MIIKTKTKIAGARAIYQSLRLVGLAAKPGEPVQVRRSGITWDLDLGEGIDFAIYLLGAFERSTSKALRRLIRPGDTVFDIGANVGAHTLPLAQAVGSEGRVFAFEPTDFAFRKLTRNLSLNPDLASRVTAAQLFLVDKPGRQQQAELYAGWPLQNAGNLHPKHLGRLESTSNARMDILDRFAVRQGIDRLDVIKIDVDGHEGPVLNGGRELLKQFKPTLVMELSPYVHAEEGNTAEQLFDILRECGYTLRDLSSAKPLSLESSYWNRTVPDGTGVNVIATAK